MKWHTLLALAVSACLTACTTLQGDRPSPAEQPATGDTQAPASGSANAATPRIPQGPMSPVTTTELRGSAVAPTETPADLWDRIRRGYAIADLDNELVREKEQWYATRPDYIQRMTERSRMYIFHIVEELELRGMPTELALLPFIESAFNPQAVSSARAAGMWQFMPATGSAYDLRQNMLRDDRRDVIASTRAALDYLQKLYDMFGDWQLALASYNWGEGNVRRAIERNRAAGLGTSYSDLRMPEETRHYVPKLQAVKNIIARPDSFGAVLPLIENHPFFDTVEIRRDIDVDVAARLAGVRLEDFKALNPSQRKPVIFAAGTPRVLLPWDAAAAFKENLAKTPTGSLASWTAWVAPSNMPARDVASRFGMDTADFLAMNNLPAKVIIKSGSTVLVRRHDDAAPAAASEVVNNARLSYAPEVVLRRTSVRARRGDSLATIAARYDLPAATVAGWNRGAAKGKLKAGQAVVLFLPVRAATRSSATAERSRARTPGKNTRLAQASPAARSQATRAEPKTAARHTAAKAGSRAESRATSRAAGKAASHTASAKAAGGRASAAKAAAQAAPRAAAKVASKAGKAAAKARR